MTEDPEALARRFHEAYERLAPSFGYETREASAKPWADVPENNRRLMTAVCAEIMGAPKEIWTHEQVHNLNEYQVAGVMHPFTCGNEHPGDKELVATVRGWICTGCDWTQDWAHEWMLSGEAVGAARRGFMGVTDD